MADSRYYLLPILALGIGANTLPAADLPLTEEPVELSETTDVAGEAAGVDLVAPVLVIPAKTPIMVEFLDDVGSKTSKTGDTFALMLAEPVVVDGVEVIPAGTMGHGEVVHAKRNGSFGVPGELVLAARTLDFQGRSIRLRSLKIAEAGKGRTEGVGLAVAAAGTPAMMVGLFVKGDQVMVEKGTVANAMIAEEFVPETEAGTVNQQSVTP